MPVAAVDQRRGEETRQRQREPGEDREVARREVAEHHLPERELIVVEALGPRRPVVGDRPQRRCEPHEQATGHRRDGRSRSPGDVEGQHRRADQGEDVPVEDILRHPDQHVERESKQDQEQAAADGDLRDLIAVAAAGGLGIGPEPVADAREKRKQRRREAGRHPPVAVGADEGAALDVVGAGKIFDEVNDRHQHDGGRPENIDRHQPRRGPRGRHGVWVASRSTVISTTSTASRRMITHSSVACRREVR